MDTEDKQLSRGASKAAKKAFKDYLNTKNTGFEALFNNEPKPN